MTPQDIKERYSETLGYLREARGFLLVAAVMFVIGTWIGVAYPPHWEDLLSGLKTMARQLKGKSTLSIAGAIFLKNSLASAMSVILGPLLGIVPLLGAIGNGLLVGTMMSHVSQATRVSMLLQLLPHGLFELPAMFMAWGIGMWQGTWFFHKGPDDLFGKRRRKAFRIYFMIIIPLLFIAALIEASSIHLATK